MFKNLLDGKKAVCFDLDGTVIDSVPVWHDVVSNIATTMGAFELDFETYGGYSLPMVWEQILKDNELNTTMNVLELSKSTESEYLQRLDEIEINPGFWELTAYLKTERELPLALVTNTVKEVTDKVYDHFKFGKTFDYVVSGDEVKNTKPAPDIYNLVAQRAKVKPNQMLVFEDSIPGATSAVSAGSTVAVIWDYKQPKYNYPEEVAGFFEDFSWLQGNLDDTLGDRFEDYVKRLEEFQKRKAEEKGMKS